MIRKNVEQAGKRETFRQATIKAWEEYESTGMHVTAEEADAWLEALENGNDVESPEGQVCATSSSSACGATLDTKTST
ncbi:transcriptional regulator [Massilia sp. CCM 8733]|uniref:Transcriptional regulator n=1 Tax=Massilia mucilaginosa TaxID=2609282 RepID=A0ABX0NYW7_9BURK|nr:transcriptional regulator [Massilia mucilaginosa]NHZ92211.1 transcriptional regulator [Massilia mucilaginosa]